MLADYGATVLRVDRALPVKKHPSDLPPPTEDLLTRRKTSIAVNLKSASGVDLIKRIVKDIDIIVDPYRPGVLEKLGLGPDVLLNINPRIIIGRMTGFRRDGKYKHMAGHDINYIAVSGVLSMLGRKDEKPSPPLNILGDFAGGGATLFQGLLLALLARQRSGQGQVVEANMVDGSAYLTTFPRLALKTSIFSRPRGENLLDSGCPYYDTYETKDGKYVAVGALEPQFFARLIKGLGLEGKGLEETREDRSTWSSLKNSLESCFIRKTRAEWEEIFDGTDACVTPVLGMRELETGHNREGDQRPSVVLSETPSLAIKRGALDRSVCTGQGNGVCGDGWSSRGLRPHDGGEQTLREWMGWQPGRDISLQDGGLVMGRSSKL